MTETQLPSLIRATLLEASPALRLLTDDWYVIGAAAMVLADVKVPHTADVDLLVSRHDAVVLRSAWEDKLHRTFVPPFADRFRSTFGRYRFPQMDVEVMGDLEVKKDEIWTPLRILESIHVDVGGLSVRIPTKSEQIRILRFFGREKDLLKINLLT